MPVDTNTIQVIIQGGAVGLLLVFGFLGYKLSRLLLSFGQEMLLNHVQHLTDEMGRVVDSVDRLTEAVLTGSRPKRKTKIITTKTMADAPVNRIRRVITYSDQLDRSKPDFKISPGRIRVRSRSPGLRGRRSKPGRLELRASVGRRCTYTGRGRWGRSPR